MENTVSRIQESKLLRLINHHIICRHPYSKPTQNVRVSIDKRSSIERSNMGKRFLSSYPTKERSFISTGIIFKRI